MARKGSLFHQLILRLRGQKEIGDSWRSRGGKQAAKRDYRQRQEEAGKAWNPSKAEGVFSNETFRSYAKSLKGFSGYLKEQGVKDADEVTRGHAVSFLRDQQKRGLSHYTVAKDSAAINKVFDYSITKHDTGIGDRSKHEIVRGRSVERDETYLQRERSNRHQIDFTKAFGTRRQSIQPSNTNYPVKPVSLFRRDGEVYCSVIEKGGRYREIECLQAHKQLVLDRYDVRECYEQRTEESFKRMYFESGEDTIFSRYDKNINNHAYRAEYACELYKQIESRYLDEGKSVVADYHGFNREICCEVAQSLGHGSDRPEVFAINYSYGFGRI